MKKRFTLLGCLIGITAVLCTFSVSATVTTGFEDDVSYSIKCEKSISNVSRETVVSFDGQAIRMYSYIEIEQRAGGCKSNRDIYAEFLSYFSRVTPYNDPYFVRTQRWIKWNNIKATGESPKVKNVAISVLFSEKLLC